MFGYISFLQGVPKLRFWMIDPIPVSVGLLGAPTGGNINMTERYYR